MNKLIKMAVIAVGAATMLAGCGGSSPEKVVESPEKVVEKFFASATSADVDGVMKCITGEFEKGFLKEKEAAKRGNEFEKFKKEMKEVFGGHKIKVVKTDINGDKATVHVKADGNEESDVKLTKVNGEWKIEGGF